jgi:hypothetical protein
MKRTLLLLFIAFAISCEQKVDLQKALQLEHVSTGWLDAGVVGGQHKIVPAASFTLKNVSDRKLGLIQLNAVFRQVNDPADWSSAFVPAAAKDLAPGASTGPIVVQGEKGYTSSDVPETMLKNTQFVDAKVDVFARHGSTNWVRLGEYPVARQLVAPPRAESRARSVGQSTTGG